MDQILLDISAWIAANKSTFTIIFWSTALVFVFFVYILFAKFRDYIINYGKITARKYMEKIDPELEDVDDLEEMDGHH